MSDPDDLLQGLRHGERDSFVRYFQLFRTPVYGFALRLLHDEDAAAATTAEALSAAFRRVVLIDGPIDLQALTYRCAFAACDVRAAAEATPAPGGRGGQWPEHAAPSPSGEQSSHIEAALDSLPLRQRAALLLHDVQGLSAARLGFVFSLTAEAAAALLFRSRVEFRGAFHVRSAHAHGEACRQAEQAVAGTVGLGLSAGELERLRSHAAYCRPCRRAMKSWRPGAFGLALGLAQAPPPQTLAAPPVFGGVAGALAAPAVAGVGRLARTLLPALRMLRSRAAAYAIAAACLALAAGLALNEESVRRFVLFESVGPAIQLVRAPDAQAAGPDRSRDGGETSATTATGVTRAPMGVQPGSQPGRTAAGTSVPAPPGGPSPTAETTDGGTANQNESRDAAASGVGASKNAVGAAKSAAADDEKRQKDKAKDKAKAKANGHSSSSGTPKAHKTQKAQKTKKTDKARKKDD